MRIYYIISILLAFSTSSCSKINTETVITDLHPTQLPFINLYADSLGIEFTKESLPSGMNEGFSVKGTIVYEDELFCTNLSAKRIDIFDARTLKYKESIIDTKMFSKDVYADDKYIYVTGLSSPRCQVSVYDRQTKEYICRLGTGSWWGNKPLVHPICVAASEKYAFVRDQGTDIKVFLKSEIGKNKSILSYCRLNIDGQQVSNTDDYDMSVIDSTLYVINLKNKTIYTYSVNIDYEKDREILYESKFTYPDNQSPKAIAASDKYMFIATNASFARINIYKRGEEKVNLAKPNFIVSSISGANINRIDFIAAKGDTLFINPNGQRVTAVHLKTRYYDETTDIPNVGINIVNIFDRPMQLQ